MIAFVFMFGTILVFPLSLIYTFKTAILLWSLFIGIVYLIFSLRNLEMYGKLKPAKISYEKAQAENQKEVSSIEIRKLLIEREEKAKLEYEGRLKDEEINKQSIHIIRILTVISGGILAAYSLLAGPKQNGQIHIQTQTIPIDSFVQKMDSLTSKVLELQTLLETEKFKDKFKSMQDQIDQIGNEPE